MLSEPILESVARINGRVPVELNPADWGVVVNSIDSAISEDRAVKDSTGFTIRAA